MAMLLNIARRALTHSVNLCKYSQAAEKSFILPKYSILHPGLRCLSDKTVDESADIDEIEQLLDQLPDAESVPHIEDMDVLEETPSLPGHTIRGIRVPTKETLTALVDGQPYERLPVAHAHSSYNNIIIRITDYTGTTFLAKASGGSVGYKNAKQRTAVAAQAAGQAAGKEAVKKGVTHVRVSINGMGQGRLASCKGLEDAGLKIVSISDNSELNWGTYFPRKRRRL